MGEKRRPWGKWYWGDWRKDARLRRCSYAARGLWIDMLSLMGGECEVFGVLMMEGQALHAADLAGLLGGSPKEVKALLHELEAKNVFSRAGDAALPDDIKALVPSSVPADAIVSRRMIRDKAKEEKDRANGKFGGNPNLTKQTDHVNQGVNPPVNREDKAQKPEARSQKLAKPTDAARAISVGKRCLELLGKANDPTWNAGIVWQWLADGADPERDIYPLIRRSIENGKASEIRTLAYYTPAVNEAIRRTKADDPDAAEKREKHQRRLRVERFRKCGEWLPDWGSRPTPDELGETAA